MASAETLQCYNKGCGQKYNPEDNKDDSCKYHPGVPVFHDALKGWSCCKKRSTDFTEFLNIPGCTQGLHSNEKPIEPEKEANDQPEGDQKEVVVVERKPEVIRAPIAEPPPRPSENEPMVQLKATVAATLKQALEKQMKDMSMKDEEKADDDTVKIGTACKNKGCGKQYQGEQSDEEICVYHSGVPIFHEGMKYWSCCQRKTSDFNTFLSQEGCASGKHVWFKKEDGEQKVACRYDWHQTPGFVTVSIFAKVADPESTVIQANQVALKVKVAFEGGKKVFQEHFILQHTIDPAKSSVKLLGTKVEILLKKGEPGSWSRLNLPSGAPET